MKALIENRGSNGALRACLRILCVACAVILISLAGWVELGSMGTVSGAPHALARTALWIILIPVSVGAYRILFSGGRRRTEALLRKRMEEHVHGILEDARHFRLEPLTNGSVPDEFLQKEHERLCRSSVLAIRSRLKSLLELCEHSFSEPPHSLLLYFLGNDYFILRAAICGSRSPVRGLVHTGRGIFGLVQQRLSPVTMSNLEARPEALPYYRLPEKISHAHAFPIVLDGKLMGILVADRRSGPVFSEEETRNLGLLSRELAQVIETERILLSLRKENYAHEKFHKAAHAFSLCKGLDEVALTTVSTAQEISGMSFAALTVRDGENEKDRIVSARWNGDPVHSLVGKKITSDRGLVAKCMKLGCALPESPYLTPQQRVFDAGLHLKELAVARVFPLLWNGRALGTLVVGDSHPDRFLSVHASQMIEVITGHAAVAVAQADLYNRMEMLATTDGLTGLFNHRAFQIKMSEALRRAGRYRKSVSLLLADLDHFKQINDRFGHPLGDRVLQHTAEILLRVSRETDVVARYGGEEFAIIMEETDGRQATMAAERIRKAMEEHAFESVHGRFHCTLSVGIAAFPEHAQDKASVITRADQALYRAKHQGRNRVSVCPPGDLREEDKIEGRRGPTESSSWTPLGSGSPTDASIGPA